MIIAPVPPKHWVLTGKDVPRAVRPFWNSEGLTELPASAALLAVVGSCAVGFWRYHRRGDILVDLGMWVHPSYRRKGVGRLLWSLGLKGVRHCAVRTVTKEGEAFVEAARADGVRVIWERA